jgi:hypothetical protein
VDYTGSVDWADYDLAIGNYDSQVIARGGLPPLARVYLLTLEYPYVYWDIRFRPQVWDKLAPYEAMNLGTIPPMPSGMSARGIPEPAVGAALVATVGGVLVRRRRPRG